MIYSILCISIPTIRQEKKLDGFEINHIMHRLIYIFIKTPILIIGILITSSVIEMLCMDVSSVLINILENG